MSSDYDDLLRMFRAANIADHVGRFDVPIGHAILHVNFQTHGFAVVDVAFKLLLVLGGHADDGDLVISIEPESAGVSKVHALRNAASLTTNNGQRSDLVSRLKKIPKLGKASHAICGRLADVNDKQNFSLPP